MRLLPRRRLVVEALEDRLAPATFTVTNVNDAGAGSLRAALTAANATAAADSIAFNISGPGAQIIDLLSPLPAITSQVKIDGGTQPGTSTSPLIDLNGTAAGGNGLTINASAAGTVVRFLAIERFAGDGIRISASSCRVEGCLIGTDSSGTIAAPNGHNGIIIFAGADNNIIGGTAPGTGNTISGNTGPGVRIGGTGTTGNRVLNNAIGREFGGTSSLPNGVGVWITNGASGNTVGGAVGNIISGNASDGVAITGPTTTGNRVLNNIIGLDDTGTVEIPNQSDGVLIGGAKSTVVDGNVISGNSGNGVVISGATGSLLRGNVIGLDDDGNIVKGNGLSGVRIDGGAKNNTIGSTNLPQANVISGNNRHGVEIVGTGTNNNTILGNYIGLDATGSFDRGNTVDGVHIDQGAGSNTIGGTAAGSRNLISGNDEDGIELAGTGSEGNKVQGNFIGTDDTGSLAIGNGSDGVDINSDAANNQIGGATASARNVIAANAASGVSISNSGTGNRIEGNFIGTDSTGTNDRGNALDGVTITADGNIVGGTAPGARNVISGNNGSGVRITILSSENTVLGNFIGTNAAGNAALGNTLDGVLIDTGASRNTIGGTTASARNVISGNLRNGILIDGFDPGGINTFRNLVQGNFIGLAANGVAPLGNARHGVLITDTSAVGNTVGGTTPGMSNRIAHNGGAGVLIGNDPSQGFSTDPASFVFNSVLSNAIFANGGLGIDLGTFGSVTPNDTNDADSGPNKLLNFPVLNIALLDGSVLFLSGSINTTTNTKLRIEFFSSPDGNGEGANFLGFILVDTGNLNTVPFSATFSSTLVKPGDFITATATDVPGSTSEFTAPLIVT